MSRYGCFANGYWCTTYIRKRASSRNFTKNFDAYIDTVRLGMRISLVRLAFTATIQCVKQNIVTR